MKKVIAFIAIAAIVFTEYFFISPAQIKQTELSHHTINRKNEKSITHTKSNHADTFEKNIKKEKEILDNWLGENGYAIFSSYDYYDQNETSTDEYAYYDLMTLESLAQSGDSKAQIWLALNYFDDDPQKSFNLLEAAIVSTNYTAAMLKLSELYITQYDIANRQAGKNSDPEQNEPFYLSALAWAMLAKSQNNPMAQTVLKQFESLPHPKLDPELIQDHYEHLSRQLKQERSLRGIEFSNTPALPQTVSNIFLDAQQQYWQYTPLPKIGEQP